MKLDIDSTLFTKINSKWVIDLNTKCKPMKITKGSIKENLDHGRHYTDDIIHERINR